MPSPHTIAIASGKGGVGKTWFSITLAHALARQGRRVLLFDGDLGLANIDIQLGFAPRLDLGHVLSGTTIETAIERYEPGGFDILAGCSGSGALAGLDPAPLDQVLGLLAGLRGYDHVLLDLGAGLEGGVRRMAGWADSLIVLATQEPTSITDAYATLKLHAADRPAGDARLVINTASSPAAAERTAATIRRACGTFFGKAPEWLGGIRRDACVPEAIRRQMLLLTRSPSCMAAQDVDRIAQAF